MISLMHQILKKMNVPLFLHPKSKHTFSIHQHIILLIPRQYESKSYESFVEWLDATTEIVIQLQLRTIPHFTTPQKAAARISEGLLHVAIGRFIGMVSPDSIFAGIDATGFETRHAAPHYTYRCNIRHAFTKMSAVSDMESQLICAVMIQHHPINHDIKHFPKLFSQMLGIIPMNVMVLGKGYGAESVHKKIRDRNILSMIPVRGNASVDSIRGKYGKIMKTEFDVIIYSQRNKTETIFSVVKRRFGSEIKSQNDIMKTKELLYRVLAYNCHRMCLISALVYVMISMKP